LTGWRPNGPSCVLKRLSRGTTNRRRLVSRFLLPSVRLSSGREYRSDRSEKEFPDTSDAPITSIHAMLGAVDEWIRKTSIARYGRSCVAYCAAPILADCFPILGT
jgi:hypothetical protein